jgi:hypothetical protein
VEVGGEGQCVHELVLPVLPVLLVLSPSQCGISIFLWMERV